MFQIYKYKINKVNRTTGETDVKQQI